jgi:tetratricopeptide (TPR) repeat protein
MDGTQASASNTASILLNEARALAAENRFTESRVLIGRVLEMDPADEAAITVLREIDKRSSGTNPASGQIPEGLLARVSALVDSGKLQSARREIDRLQQSYPEAPEIMTLRKRWQAKISGGTRQQARTQEKQQNAALNQNETEWNRQLAELVAAGKYNEASGALSLWLAANPGSAQAQEFGAKINEIQRGLQVYTSAMSKNRYQDALSALRGVEKINPADPNLAEMRRQIESRKAAARAVLTVRRLGTKGTILLDGRRIGNDGEIESESIPIGSHTLAIENKGGLVASNTQEYQEGQRVSYVYDIAKLNLRPMTGSDRELLARRKAMEEVHRFKVEHDHGLLRGSCRGTLSVDYLDVVYQPASGAHGFQMPLKQLKLRGEGKSVDLFYVSDNQRFQSFKFQDEQTAERFKRTWGDLKAITQ